MHANVITPYNSSRLSFAIDRGWMVSAVIHPCGHGDMFTEQNPLERLKSSRGDSWVKWQLYRSAHIYRRQWDTLKWDTMCMELYCSPESAGQFGPSADPAASVTRTSRVINCIGIVSRGILPRRIPKDLFDAEDPRMWTQSKSELAACIVYQVMVYSTPKPTTDQIDTVFELLRLTVPYVIYHIVIYLHLATYASS